MKNIFHQLFRRILPQKNSAEIKREFKLPENLDLVFEITADGWFVVTCPDLPGFLTQAKDYDELIVMVNDAVLCYFDVPGHRGAIVYDHLDIGDRVVQYSGRLQTQTV